MLTSALYFTLYSFAIYFSNNIYGKVILLMFVMLILNSLCKKTLDLFLCIMIVCLSFFNEYFIVFLSPFLPNNKLEKYVFINCILIRFIFEHLYFLGCDYIILFYYIWGIPLLFLSIIITLLLKKYSFIILYIGAIVSVIGLFTFNQKINNMPHYTVSKDNAVVANYDILKKAFVEIENISIDEISNKKQGYFIYPLAEDKDIVKNNYIQSGKVYLLLAEHDNLNGFLRKYPYFNNNAYQIPTPWNLYKPNFSLPFKYLTSKDIFYSSNIGGTLNRGHPIIWSYSKLGKPIVLASLTTINDSKVFLWGDSDYMVSKLLSYNIHLANKMSGNDVWIYYLFSIMYLISFILLNKKNIYIFISAISVIIYFYPINTISNNQITLYTQAKFYSAHNEADVGSYLNILGKDNIPVIQSDKNSQIIILSKSEKLSKFNNAKLIYLLSGAKLTFDGTSLECSNIKIGNKHNIKDSRLLIKNKKLLDTGIYNHNSIVIMCTGSPQLNTQIVKDILANEK